MGSEWREARLEDVCAGVFDCPHSTPELTSTGPYVVRSQDIRSGVLRLDNAARVSESTYRDRITRAEPGHGDLLYSREGTYFGIAAEVPRTTRLCLGQRMVLIRPNRAVVDSRFLLYWLNSPLMAAHTQARRDGSVAERLNLPTIRSLPVPLPPLWEQGRIAGILGALDDKIELNRHMSQTLESIARALFKSWFVDFDPVRAKADARDPGIPASIAELLPSRLDDSALGEVPQGWLVRSVAEEFRLTMGQSPAGDTYNEVGDGLPFYQGRSDFGARFPGRRVYCNAPTRVANSGDTLVSVRAPVGDINIATEACAIGRGVAALRHLGGAVSYTHLMMDSLRDVLAAFDAEGTVFGAINRDAFRRLLVVAPPLAVVQAFEDRASTLEGQLSTLHGEISCLRELRDELLPRLVSGQLPAAI